MKHQHYVTIIALHAIMLSLYYKTNVNVVKLDYVLKPIIVIVVNPHIYIIINQIVNGKNNIH